MSEDKENNQVPKPQPIIVVRPIKPPEDRIEKGLGSDFERGDFNTNDSFKSFLNNLLEDE